MLYPRNKTEIGEILKVSIFGGTFCLHLQDQRISQARTKREAGGKLSHADFLLGLFFDPQFEGDMFLRNVD
jgi:hypothetical protein